MIRHPSYLFFLFIISSAVLSGCATQQNNNLPAEIVNQSPIQRAAYLAKINQWRLRGKIAFIAQLKNNESKRESATMTWHVNQKTNSQELNLTSYLGINVLHLESTNNSHQILVDGKEYRSNNLTQLIHSLTGLTLPAKALTFWLKGLPFQPTDKVTLSTNTQLPLSLQSQFNNIKWQVGYRKYQVFDGVQMATQFTIKKDDLLIKIAVKDWSLIH